jgi:hypothetical protein
MLAKVWTVAVAAAIAGVLALPAPAAYAQATTTKPAAKPMAMSKPMTMKKSSHKMGCYDYAWQSAAMNDCLAKGTSSTSDGMSKPMKKAKKKKMSS